MLVETNDRSKTLLLALALGVTTLAFIVAKTGRDALFFQGSGGLLQLPLIYINIGAASLPLAIVFVKAMKIWGARPADVLSELPDGSLQLDVRKFDEVVATQPTETFPYPKA